jgi:hypothetical protein
MSNRSLCGDTFINTESWNYGQIIVDAYRQSLGSPELPRRRHRLQIPAKKLRSNFCLTFLECWLEIRFTGTAGQMRGNPFMNKKSSMYLWSTQNG